MAEAKVTGSSQRNAKDVAIELTELYYRVSKEEAKSPEEVGETYGHTKDASIGNPNSGRVLSSYAHRQLCRVHGVPHRGRLSSDMV